MEYKVDNFKSLDEHLNKEDNIIFVKGKNCGVCDVLYPIIKDLSNSFDVDLLTVQIEDFKEFSGKYTVFTIPTVIVFYYKQEMLRESRFIDQTKIKKYFVRKRMYNNQ